jgi:hypothetical protein
MSAEAWIAAIAVGITVLGIVAAGGMWCGGVYFRLKAIDETLREVRKLFGKHDEKIDEHDNRLVDHEQRIQALEE